MSSWWHLAKVVLGNPPLLSTWLWHFPCMKR
ncbi:hypothetical protein MRX96_013719 [Rhipicephalus microplus]